MYWHDERYGIRKGERRPKWTLQVIREVREMTNTRYKRNYYSQFANLFLNVSFLGKVVTTFYGQLKVVPVLK